MSGSVFNRRRLVPRWMLRCLHRCRMSVHDFVILYRDFDEPFVLRPTRIPVTVQEATPALYQALLRKAGAEDSDNMRWAHGRGHRCFVALHGDDIAGYTWTNANGITLFRGNIALRMLRGEVYSYLSLVFPRYRGCRIFQRLKLETFRRLRQEGYRGAYSLVYRKNVASGVAQMRVGARPVRRMFALHLGWGLWCSWPPLRCVWRRKAVERGV